MSGTGKAIIIAAVIIGVAIVAAVALLQLHCGEAVCRFGY